MTPTLDTCDLQALVDSLDTYPERAALAVCLQTPAETPSWCLWAKCLLCGVLPAHAVAAADALVRQGLLSVTELPGGHRAFAVLVPACLQRAGAYAAVAAIGETP